MIGEFLFKKRKYKFKQGYKKGFIDGVNALIEHQKISEAEDKINRTYVGVDRVVTLEKGQKLVTIDCSKIKERFIHPGRYFTADYGKVESVLMAQVKEKLNVG